MFIFYCSSCSLGSVEGCFVLLAGEMLPAMASIRMQDHTILRVWAVSAVSNPEDPVDEVRQVAEYGTPKYFE